MSESNIDNKYSRTRIVCAVGIFVFAWCATALFMSDTISAKISTDSVSDAKLLSTPEYSLNELAKVPDNVSSSAVKIEFFKDYLYPKSACSGNILYYENQGGYYLVSTASHCFGSLLGERTIKIQLTQPQLFGKGVNFIVQDEYWTHVKSVQGDFALLAIKAPHIDGIDGVGVENIIMDEIPPKEANFVSGLYPGIPNSGSAFDFVIRSSDKLRNFRSPIPSPNYFSIDGFYAEDGESGGGIFTTNERKKRSVGKLYGVVSSSSGVDPNVISIIPSRDEFKSSLELINKWSNHQP